MAKLHLNTDHPHDIEIVRKDGRVGVKTSFNDEAGKSHEITFWQDDNLRSKKLATFVKNVAKFIDGHQAKIAKEKAEKAA